MDIYSWVIFLYVAGTLVVGWFLLNETGMPAGWRQKKGSMVGPTYWGYYQGSAGMSEKRIKLQEFNDEDDEEGGLCGRSAYAGGKAVKSARC
jgi:hypothetical protein